MGKRGSGHAGSLASCPRFGGVSAWIGGVVPDGMDPRSLSRAIVGSCTWGGTQLPLLLLVHDIPLLW